MGKNSAVQESMVVSRNLPSLNHKTVLPPLKGQVPRVLPPPPRTPGGRRKFANESQLRCGVNQIIGGITAIVLGIGAILAGSGGTKSNIVGSNVNASGIWGGFVMIIAGILGVVSSKNEKSSTITACMVLSVFSMLCAILFVGFSADMLATDLDKTYYATGRIRTVTAATMQQRQIVDAVSIVVGIMVFIVAIVQSAICGRALCYENKRKRERRVFFLAQPLPDGAMPSVRDGAIVIMPAGGHHHPRPALPPHHREDDSNIPGTPPPKYDDQMAE